MPTQSKSKALVATKIKSLEPNAAEGARVSDSKSTFAKARRMVSDATTATTAGTRKAATAAAVSAKKSAAAGKQALVYAGDATVKAGKAVGKTASEVGAATAKGAGIVGMTLLDLNNDGKIDEEDFKMAMERGLAVAKQAADELASSDTVKGAAKSGIVVATIAIPVPIVGPAFGFAVGAGGYLGIKAIREIGEAIGTAVGGVRSSSTPVRRIGRTKK